MQLSMAATFSCATCQSVASMTTTPWAAAASRSAARRSSGDANRRTLPTCTDARRFHQKPDMRRCGAPCRAADSNVQPLPASTKTLPTGVLERCTNPASLRRPPACHPRPAAGRRRCGSPLQTAPAAATLAPAVPGSLQKRLCSHQPPAQQSMHPMAGAKGGKKAVAAGQSAQLWPCCGGASNHLRTTWPGIKGTPGWRLTATAACAQQRRRRCRRSPVPPPLPPASGLDDEPSGWFGLLLGLE